MTTPPELRFLKWLVTALAGVMMVGIAVIVGVLVLRLGPAVTPLPLPALPDHVSLPADSRASAVTFGQGWIAVVTEGQEILIFDAASGELRQRFVID